MVPRRGRGEPRDDRFVSNPQPPPPEEAPCPSHGDNVRNIANIRRDMKIGTWGHVLLCTSTRSVSLSSFYFTYLYYRTRYLRGYSIVTLFSVYTASGGVAVRTSSRDGSHHALHLARFVQSSLGLDSPPELPPNLVHSRSLSESSKSERSLSPPLLSNWNLCRMRI